MFSTIARTATVAFAAAAATLSVPAGAAELQPGVAIAPVSAPTASPNTRYCVVVKATTGTIIDRKVCRTRDQWLAQGVDPLAKTKSQ